jgi:N-acetylmuramoyl-L-alanine amidase
MLAATAVDRRARHIEDPLTRLRYLRVAAVGIKPSASLGPLRWRYAAVVALAVAAAACVAAKASLWPEATREVRRPSPAHAAGPASTAAVDQRFPDVWLVEQNEEREEYSNGLQIDCRLSVSNRPRSYAAFDTAHPERGPVGWRNEPAGIVFHTTESLQVPFEPLQNGTLRHITGGLIEYVRRKRAYHFLVDRFGRVHSIVREGDAANHAGHSVWADDRWLYLDLNDSFFGVSFEAQTRHGEPNTPITPAQVRAGQLLVEMLRAPARNCVTHAQVSVNPANMRIGYHTDWADNFPFREIGLPDNYVLPLPGLYLCGFVYDQSYVVSTGPRILAAIKVSEDRLDEAAARRQTPAASYREYLQQQYHQKIMALKKETPEGDS